MMLWTDLESKTIGIWGTGREGLAACAAVTKHVRNSNIIEITEDNTDAIGSCDILIKSPGVSLYRPEIRRAVRDGIVVTSGTNLFFANKNPAVRVIAVTGTKGKSTTSSLLAHTLNGLGYWTILGGNIGRPLLDLVDEKPDFFVTELSSYQCADCTGRPDIGILTNLYPEHLQWHLTHDQYYADKLNLIGHCHRIVLNGADPRTIGLTGTMAATRFNIPTGIHVQDGQFWDDKTPLFSREDLNLIGDHNAENACAVLTAIRLLGLNPTDCRAFFRSFTPLPHRLQTVGTKGGLTFVDDSISTTPETAVAAIKALDRGQPLTLIAGGFDRGQDYTVLIDGLKGRDVRLITLPDTGIRLAELARAANIVAVEVDDMATAVHQARQITPNGGTVILSPAAPSYNRYRNFEERGDEFQNLVI